MSDDRYEGIRLRLHLGTTGVLGPGRVELLSLIDQTGSIAAAGRMLKMSYKRAWSLVEDLNGVFCEPLVEMSRGGSAHGGAALTPLGREVVSRYNALVARAIDAIADDLAHLRKLARQRDDAG